MLIIIFNSKITSKKLEPDYESLKLIQIYSASIYSF